MGGRRVCQFPGVITVFEVLSFGMPIALLREASLAIIFSKLLSNAAKISALPLGQSVDLRCLRRHESQTHGAHTKPSLVCVRAERCQIKKSEIGILDCCKPKLVLNKYAYRTHLCVRTDTYKMKQMTGKNQYSSHNRIRFFQAFPLPVIYKVRKAFGRAAFPSLDACARACPDVWGMRW